MEPRTNYRGTPIGKSVTRHVEFDEEPNATGMPLRRPGDPKYHSQMLSHDLEPAYDP